MSKSDFSSLRATYVNCTLKKSPQNSHTALLMSLSQGIMAREKVAVDEFRLADHDVPAGVYPDMTKHGYEKDEWPALFQRILESDILVIGTPIWLGVKSSQAQKLIERLYGMSGQLNDKGQNIFYGRVGGCIVTGNEDGAKQCSRDLLYGLQHIGYSIPPQADAAWLGEIGPGPSYLDEGSGAADHDFTNRNATFMTYNLLHLAKMLKGQGGYPPYGNSTSAWGEGERWAFEKPAAGAAEQ